MSQTSMRPPKEWTRQLRKEQSSVINVFDTQTGTSTAIYEMGELIEAPNWTLDGKWLIVNGDGRLWRISPDGNEGPNRINTVPVENWNNDHCLSPDGKHIYVSALDGHVYHVSLEGGAPKKISEDQEGEARYMYFLHGVSPDDKTLAYVALEMFAPDNIKTRIGLIPSTGGDPVHLTDGSCPVDGPEFHPNGEWIYFNSEAAAKRPGHAQIFRMRPDGSDVEQLTFDERVNWFPHISPDGKQLVYISFPEGTEGHPADLDVQLVAMSPEGGETKVLESFFGGQGTINVNSWSPDSRYFAYVTYPIEE